MVYAKVSDPIHHQDYYQVVATLDVCSEKLYMNLLRKTQQHTLHQLVESRKTLSLEETLPDEIIDINPGEYRIKSRYCASVIGHRDGGIS